MFSDENQCDSTIVGCNYLFLNLLYMYIIFNREKARQEENSRKSPEESTFQSADTQLDEGKMARERKREMKKLLIQTFKENHQVGTVISPYLAFCGIK